MKIFSEKNVKISKFIFSKCRNRSCQNRFKALPILKFKFSWSNKRLRKENITQVLLKVHFSFDKQERKFSVVLLIVKQVSFRSQRLVIKIKNDLSDKKNGSTAGSSIFDDMKLISLNFIGLGTIFENWAASFKILTNGGNVNSPSNLSKF